MIHFVDLKGKPLPNTNKLKLLETAVGLFSNKGYHDVSIREITKATGIKESSFYNHYCSKQVLLDTIFHNFRLSIAKIMPPLHMIDRIIMMMEPVEFLMQGYRNFLEHIGQPLMEEIWRLLYMEQFRNEQARDIYLNEITGQTVTFLETVFASYIALKRMRALNPRYLAMTYQYTLFTMICEYLLLRLDGKETVDIELSMTEHIKQFAHITVP